MKIDPKDIEYEFPEPDNTKGEHLRFVCDATHVPTGMRARGRGSNRELAKTAAQAAVYDYLED